VLLAGISLGWAAFRSDNPDGLHQAMDLQGAVLAPADLTGLDFVEGPSAWWIGVTAGCAALLPSEQSTSYLAASASFQRGPDGPFLWERLYEFADARTSADVFHGVGDAASRCDSAASGTDAGVAVSISSQPPGTSYADGTASLRIHTTGLRLSAPVVSDLVAIQHGQHLIMVMHSSYSSIDEAVTASTVRLAYDKVATLG
jgi:hypothetical protein